MIEMSLYFLPQTLQHRNEHNNANFTNIVDHSSSPFPRGISTCNSSSVPKFHFLFNKILLILHDFHYLVHIYEHKYCSQSYSALSNMSYARTCEWRICFVIRKTTQIDWHINNLFYIKLSLFFIKCFLLGSECRNNTATLHIFLKLPLVNDLLKMFLFSLFFLSRTSIPSTISQHMTLDDIMYSSWLCIPELLHMNPLQVSSFHSTVRTNAAE